MASLESLLGIFQLQQKLKAQEKRDMFETERMLYMARSDQEFKRDQLTLAAEIKREESGLNLLSKEIESLRLQEFALQNTLDETGYFKKIDKTDAVNDIVTDLTGGIKDRLGYLSNEKNVVLESISNLRQDKTEIDNVMRIRMQAVKEFPKIAAMGAGEFEIDTPAEVAALRASFPEGMPDRFKIYKEDYKLSDPEIFAMNRQIYDTKQALDVKLSAATLETQIKNHDIQDARLKQITTETDQTEQVNILNVSMAIDKQYLTNMDILSKNSQNDINSMLMTSLLDFSVHMPAIQGLEGAFKDDRMSIYDYLGVKQSKSDFELSYDGRDVTGDKKWQDLDLREKAFEAVLETKFGDPRAMKEWTYNIGSDITRAINSLVGESPNWGPWSQLMERFISEYKRKEKEMGDDFTTEYIYENTVLGHAGFLTDKVQRDAMSTLSKAYETRNKANDEIKRVSQKQYQNPLTLESKILKNLKDTGGIVEEADEDIFEEADEDIFGAAGGPPRKPPPDPEETAKAATALETLVAEQALKDEDETGIGGYVGVGVTATSLAAGYKWTTGQFDKTLMDMAKRVRGNWVWKDPGSKILSAAEFKKEFGAGTKLSGSALKDLLRGMSPAELEKWLVKNHGASMWNQTTIKKFFKSLSGSPKGFIKFMAKGGGLVPYILEPAGNQIDKFMFGPDGPPVFENLGRAGYLAWVGKRHAMNNQSFLRYLAKKYPEKAGKFLARQRWLRSPGVKSKFYRLPVVGWALAAVDLGLSIGTILAMWDDFKGLIPGSKTDAERVQAALEKIGKE